MSQLEAKRAEIERVLDVESAVGDRGEDPIAQLGVEQQNPAFPGGDRAQHVPGDGLGSRRAAQQAPVFALRDSRERRWNPEREACEVHR